MRDPDIWWHLRNAQTLLTTHHFIRQDTYSFTTFCQSWINPEWLAEIPYYLAFRVFAERGVFLVMLLAVELIIAGVLLLCYRRSGHISASWLATCRCRRIQFQGELSVQLGMKEFHSRPCSDTRWS